MNHRILTDIAAVEKSYDDKWEGMQEKEKEKVFSFLMKSNSIDVWVSIRKISVCVSSTNLGVLIDLSLPR